MTGKYITTEQKHWLLFDGTVLQIASSWKLKFLEPFCCCVVLVLQNLKAELCKGCIVILLHFWKKLWSWIILNISDYSHCERGSEVYLLHLSQKLELSGCCRSLIWLMYFLKYWYLPLFFRVVDKETHQLSND